METIKIHWSLLNCCAPHLTGDKGFYSRCRRLLAWSHKWLESKWPMFYFHFPKLFQIDVPLLCQLHLIDEFPALGTSPFIKFITKILSGCLCHQQEHWGRLQYSVLIKKNAHLIVPRSIAIDSWIDLLHTRMCKFYLSFVSAQDLFFLFCCIMPNKTNLDIRFWFVFVLFQFWEFSHLVIF